jgi:hypothetical protein
MLGRLFENKAQSRQDAIEVKALLLRYGENTVSVLTERAEDTDLSSRDRDHWKRILRKARQMA